MNEVKTIVCHNISDSECFDEEVNKAIEEGWTVVNRQAIAGHAKPNHNYEEKLIAFLEREKPNQ